MLVDRQAVVEAILRAGHIPAGMELFAAGDESQMETIRRWIDDSDIFLLILGGRYGSLEPQSGKGYVELEYEHAVANKKPLFAAVIDKEYLEAKVKTYGSSAIETAQGNLLEAFRQKVTAKICRFFKDATELKLIVFESLSNFERNEGLTGWVRGADVIDPKATLEELSHLQAENASLREQLEAAKAFLSSLASQQTVESTLTKDAVDILVSAAKHDGKILHIRYGNEASLVAGNRQFIVPKDSKREEARWKGALDELLDLRLIEALGYQGETFRVTRSGYEVVDKIGTEADNSSK
jgi:hypothetical protein